MKSDAINNSKCNICRMTHFGDELIWDDILCDFDLPQFALYH
jgi:hypothetical protein